MRHPLPVLLASLAAMACSAADSKPDNADTAAEGTDGNAAVQAILENPLGEKDYREERSCLWQRQVDKIEIVDETLLVFHGRVHGKAWLNKLSTSCTGLRRDMVITTRSRNGSLCRLSGIDARPRGASPFEPAVRCWLGGFETIDEVQVEALKRAVDERSKARREAGGQLKVERS